MSYYPPSENGVKVNMIKQRFERNVSPKEQPARRPYRDVEEIKDSLRRSLSASPVKSKKNLKLNVSRQLSNPGKNIKRTPAFRGDKFSRTKNLRSPTRERLVSIVDQNVKIFEDKPEYGKIGSVKKKLDESNLNAERNEDIGDASANAGSDSEMRMLGWKYLRGSTGRETSENRVRTTVISRQKNISPIYKRDEPLVIPPTTMSNGKTGNWSNREQESERFLKNGAEYTRVIKRSEPFLFFDNRNGLTSEKYIFKSRVNDKYDILDVREELSRRIAGSYDEDVIDGGVGNFFDIATKEACRVGLTDRLKAALRAPLPPGPPPKKPPRTFAHGHNYDGKIVENNNGRSDEDYQPFPPLYLGEPSAATTGIIGKKKVVKISTSSGGVGGGIGGGGGGGDATIAVSGKIKNSAKEPRDSKKMLEKLEHVLIEHKKALGPIIPPSENKNNETSQNDKRRSIVRLSRTLEDSKKIPSQIRDSKNRKHSTFDCLPSLNCATCSVYEPVKDANFKSYFTESCSLGDSKITVSKSADPIENSSLLLGNSEFYDQITTSPAAKRFSTEFSTFSDGKGKRDDARRIKERVYAEPFAFDKNSGTDITGYGTRAPEAEHNYFSRSLEEERLLQSSKDDSRTRQNFLSRERDKTLKPELHYMCTSIERALVYEDNNNVTENYSGSSKSQRTTGITKNLSLKLDHPGGTTGPNKHEKNKVEELLNRAFGKLAMARAETPSDSNASSDTDSLVSSGSMSDQLTSSSSSFNDKLRLLKNRENTTRPNKDELHRSLTEKRKNYVRRVSSKYTEKREGTSFVDRRDKLFQVCLLVELNLSTREPYIKDKYPVYAKTPAWIENFCFPDATDWPPSSQSSQNQFYSLALMDERGNRSYGYCCRVRPEDGPILPLAYCLITKYRASGFYKKVLLQLESRHGLPDKRRRSFIEELYNSPMPKPGQSLRMTTDDVNRESSTTTPPPPINEKFTDSSDKSSPVDKTEPLSSVLLSNEMIINTEIIKIESPNDSMENLIMRSGDPRLEERDMSQLFDALSNKVLVILFASLLLERKVVLLSDKLSKLSSCVEALESLLYPFTWPHTFIPVLPDIPGLSEILEAPLPFVIGIFKSKNSANTRVTTVQDGIVVDLDTSKIVCSVGDESSILPSRLQKKIRSDLQLVSSNTKCSDGIRNFLVSEAFLRAFVETCSHYDSHIVTQQDGKVIFQKESFVKACSSKTEQYFLEWFVETTMFTTFVQYRIERVERSGSCERDDIKLFHQRIAEYREGSEKNAQTKKSCSKKKTLGDRLKDLTNFHA